MDLDLSYSRQGNRYAGDTMLTTPAAIPTTSTASETNTIHCNAFSLIHCGRENWSDSRFALGHDYTRNARLNEGLASGPEGAPKEGAGWNKVQLRNLCASGEVNVPLSLGLGVVTVSAEYLRESLVDPDSLRANSWDPTPGSITGFGRGKNRSKANSHAVFVEDNIEAGKRTIITPGVRMDHHDEFRTN